MSFLPISIKQGFDRLPPYLAALLLLAAVIVKLAGLLRDASWGYGLLHSDDAYYYVLAARNFVDLGFFTADGLNATNGFHPLWAWLLVGYYAIAGTTGSLVSQVFGISVLEAAIRLIAVAGCIGAAWRWRDDALASGFLGIALLLAWPYFHLFEMGMEATLAVLMFGAAIAALLARRPIWLGICLSAMFLARLDTVVFVTPWLLLCVLRTQGFRNASIATGITGVTFLGFTLFTWFTTGHMKPISGALKSSFPVPQPSMLQIREQFQILEWNGLGYTLTHPNMLLVVFMCVVAALVAWRKGVRAEQRWLILCMIAAALSQLLNFALFQKWSKSVEVWYYAMPLACSMFAMFAGLGLVAVRGSTFSLARIFASLLAVICLWQAVAAFPPKREVAFAGPPVFKPIMDLTQPADILASTDSGALSFWTGRRVINLDGLVNNHDYQHRLAKGELRAYLTEKKVAYIALAHWGLPGQETTRRERMYAHRHFPEGIESARYASYDFHVYAYLHGVESDRITFRPSDEVFRQYLGDHGGTKASFILYRFPPGNGEGIMRADQAEQKSTLPQ